MAEYIERRTAIEHLNGWCGVCGSAVECILAEPAADVAPVRHGRWIIDSVGGKIACSDCGCIYLGYNGRLTPNYCPNCGAMMDGGDSDAAD